MLELERLILLVDSAARKVKEGAPVISSHFVCTCKLFIL